MILHSIAGDVEAARDIRGGVSRDDLVANHDALERYRVQLAEDDSETVRLMSKLTRLRLQDIIAWAIASGR